MNDKNIKKLGHLIKEINNDKINDVHVSLPAKIKKFYPKKLRADIILLNKKEMDDEFVEIPPIIDCPVRTLKTGSFVIRPPYQKDDVVQVVFSEKALDNLLITGKSEEIELDRHHSLDDAIVIGGLQLDNDSELTGEHLNDLYIANINNNCELSMTESGSIEIDNETNQITVEKDGSIKINSGNNVEIDCNDADVTSSGNTTIETSIAKLIADEIKLGSSNPGDVVALLSELNDLKNLLLSHTHPYVLSTGTPATTSSTTSVKTDYSGSSKVVLD